MENVDGSDEEREILSGMQSWELLKHMLYFYVRSLQEYMDNYFCNDYWKEVCNKIEGLKDELENVVDQNLPREQILHRLLLELETDPLHKGRIASFVVHTKRTERNIRRVVEEILTSIENESIV